MRDLRVRLGLAALAAGLLARPGRGTRRVRREGQGRLYQVRLLGLPRHLGQGGIAGPKLAPGPDAGRGVQRLRAHHQSRDAALLEAVLSNEDLADIYAYMQSIPKPADYKTIPLLNQ